MLERPQATTAVSIDTSSPKRVGTRKMRAGLDDRMAEKAIGLEIVELRHADGAFHQMVVEVSNIAK